jgi:hypothetical protein
MKRVIGWPVFIFLLLLLTGCERRKYTLTIFNARPDGKTGKEVHTISAAADSTAYARAATLYFLSLHAYKLMSDNAKPYVSKPVDFLLVNGTGKRVDSIIGTERARMIKRKVDSVIN